MRTKGLWRKGGVIKGCLTLICLGVLGFCLLGLLMPKPPRQAIVQPSARIATVNVGDKVAVFRQGGAGNAHVASDSESYDEMLAVLDHGKLSDFTRMREDGRLMIVVNGTLATVLEIDRQRVKLRIEEGEHTGQMGWIQ